MIMIMIMMIIIIVIIIIIIIMKIVIVINTMYSITAIMPESRIVGVEATSRKSGIPIKCSMFVAKVLPFEWRDAS